MTNTGLRIGWRDVAIFAALTVLGFLLMLENAQDAEVQGSYLAIPGWLLISTPMLWRRVAPVKVAWLVLGGLVVHIALFGSLVRCGAMYPLLFVLGFTIGMLVPDKRESLIGMSVAMVSGVVMSAGDWIGFGVFIVTPLIAVLWGVGRLAGARMAMAKELRARTAELRVARDQRAQLEVDTERARLSAELGEAIEKRLADLAELAEAGAGAADPTRPLEQIENESRATLEQMRAIVGALRAEQGVVAMAPPPTLAHLEALLVRAKGEDARLEVEGTPRVLPAGVELSAYRVVEALLDAMEDAPGVEVEVRFGDDALTVTVSGSMRKRSQAGAAVERARERVQLHSGTLKTSNRDGRASATAQLPVLARV